MYEWISSGGCERCDAMEGFYDEEPVRPHPNCQCEIINHGAETANIIEAEWDDYEWDLERRWFDNGVRNRKGVLTIRGTVRVTCQNGAEFFDDVDIQLDLHIEGDQVDFPLEEIDWDDQWMEKAMEVGEQLATQCPDFLCC